MSHKIYYLVDLLYNYYYQHFYLIITALENYRITLKSQLHFFKAIVLIDILD